jgi:hypothetical protein
MTTAGHGVALYPAIGVLSLCPGRAPIEGLVGETFMCRCRPGVAPGVAALLTSLLVLARAVSALQ